MKGVKIIGKYLTYIMTILILTFLLPRIIPGSPLELSETDTYILNQSLPEETFNAFRDYYEPEKSLGSQFITYIKHMTKLDFGYSFYYKMPVGDLVLGRIPWTLIMSMGSILISSFIAIPLAVSRGLKNKKDKVVLPSMIVIQALPVFLISILIQLVFAYRLNLFPSSGAYTPGMEFGDNGFIMDVIKHSFLPMITLVLGEVPSIYILAYNSVMKVKKENYIMMAQYLNIKPKDIKKKYLIPNIFPEILGKLNIQVIYAITGSLFVESVFSYPGMGQLLKVAAANRDYPLLQGILLMVAIYGVVINYIFEIILKKSVARY